MRNFGIHNSFVLKFDETCHIFFLKNRFKWPIVSTFSSMEFLFQTIFVNEGFRDVFEANSNTELYFLFQKQLLDAVFSRC